MRLNVRVISLECLQVFSASKAYGDTKDQAIRNAVLVITALAAYNPHHPEQSLHMSSFASNICLLTALKLTAIGY